jgi:hypothetical protein
MGKRSHTASRRLCRVPDRMFQCDTTASKVGELVTLHGNELAQEILPSRDDRSFHPPNAFSQSAFLYNGTGGLLSGRLLASLPSDSIIATRSPGHPSRPIAAAREHLSLSEPVRPALAAGNRRRRSRVATSPPRASPEGRRRVPRPATSAGLRPAAVSSSASFARS